MTLGQESPRSQLIYSHLEYQGYKILGILNVLSVEIEDIPNRRLVARELAGEVVLHHHFNRKIEHGFAGKFCPHLMIEEQKKD